MADKDSPPVADAADEKARKREDEKQAYIVKKVAEAHEKELPKLGGPVEDNWKPS